jgi:serine protease Do
MSFSLLKNMSLMFFLVSSSFLLTGLNSHAFQENLIGQLENAVKKVVATAEPSVGCILVSRSPRYKELGAVPLDNIPGKLGGFTPSPDPQKRPRKPLEKPKSSLDLSDPETFPDSFGTGVVVDPSGLILTMAHVVKDAVKIYVRFPSGKGSYADIHALDGRSDLAVLRLIEKIPDLKPLKIGDASSLKKGQFLIHISNPFASGFYDGSPSVGWAMLSNLRRKWNNQNAEVDRTQVPLYQYGTLLQLNTVVKPGGSGGALLTMDGTWVGILASIAGWPGVDSSEGYAVPLDINHRKIIEVLCKGEEVEYGFLGVQMAVGARNVKVAQVSERSPAFRAGIYQGDTIVSINGQAVDNPDDLFLHIGSTLAGNIAQVEVVGVIGNKPRVVPVKLAKYLSSLPVIASNQRAPVFGITVDYSSLLAQRPFGIGQWGRGVPDSVLIKDVLPGSPAEIAKLQSGKLIARVDDIPVSSPEEFYKAMAKAIDSVSLTIIQTDGVQQEIVVLKKN